VRPFAATATWVTACASEDIAPFRISSVGRSPDERDSLRRPGQDLGGWHSGRERIGDFPRHPVRFLVLVAETDDADVAAGAAHRDQRLWYAMLVVAHAADRRLQNLGAGAEVPSQHDLRPAGVTLGEAEDVPRVGVTPAVDQLVVVSHHAQVPVRAGEQVHERRLGAAGVLVLVDQDPAPPLTKPGQPVRVLVEQSHREREEVIEVERV
jgi:hypothetical protein